MRTWCKVREQEQHTAKIRYIAKNKETGERKVFNTFTQMQCWYITLGIMDMLAWSSWEVSY